MQAIISSLDDPYREATENIWGELKAVFGLKAVIGSTRPHFTYHVAEQYDAARIDAAIQTTADSERRYVIQTEGVGIFTGAETVLYLAVHRGPELMRMHARVAESVAGIATNARAVYARDTWIPHITLALGDIEAAQIDDVARFVAGRDAQWEVPVTNLTLVTDTSSAAAEWRRFGLRL
jgi:2'-5' RNA ligase